MSGKGSNPRPFSVTKEEFESNWDKIFSKEKELQSICPKCGAIAEECSSDNVDCEITKQEN